jgi:hypothetical protein
MPEQLLNSLVGPYVCCFSGGILLMLGAGSIFFNFMVAATPLDLIDSRVLEGLVVGVLTLFAAVPMNTSDIWEGCGSMCLQSSDSLG